MIINLIKFSAWIAFVSSPIYGLYLFAVSAGL